MLSANSHLSCFLPATLPSASSPPVKVLLSKNRTCCPSQRGWPAPSATLPGFVASNHSFQNISILSLTLLVCPCSLSLENVRTYLLHVLVSFPPLWGHQLFLLTNTHERCDHAHGIEAKHSHCESSHAQTTLLKLLQRDKRKRQLFNRCPARKQKICFTSTHPPLYNCLILST